MTGNHTSDRGIDSLDQRHLMSIILFLHENGPSGKMEIYDAVSRNASMPKRLGALMELNIGREPVLADGDWKGHRGQALGYRGQTGDGPPTLKTA